MKENSGLFDGTMGDKQSKTGNDFPQDVSKLKHIFGNRPGHLPDTPYNRNTLKKVANNGNNFRGIDKWGNSWYTENTPSGGQYWVEVRNNTIIEGGYNRSPKQWNDQTGLCSPDIPKI